MKALSLLLDFLSPPICPYCREKLYLEGGHLCPDCEKLLPQMPERRCPGCGGPNTGFMLYCNDCIEAEGGRPWKSAVMGYPYSGIIRDIIHLYKYRKNLALAPFLASQMVESWEKYQNDQHIDGITYIPLHLTRYITRGYNQAEILAAMVAKALNLPVLRTLKRNHKTRQQAKLDFKQRLSNMSRAFTPIHSDSRIKGKELLLIDDVFTTGATLSAATKTLLSAGAKSVSVLCAAKA